MKTLKSSSTAAEIKTTNVALLLGKPHRSAEGYVLLLP